MTRHARRRSDYPSLNGSQPPHPLWMALVTIAGLFLWALVLGLVA